MLNATKRKKERKSKSKLGRLQNSDVKVLRAGFEPATTVCFSDNKDILKNLEGFKLFVKAKLNLSQGAVYYYVSKVRTFLVIGKLSRIETFNNYIEKKKQKCCLDSCLTLSQLSRLTFEILRNYRL